MGVKVETYTRSGLTEWLENDIRRKGLRPGDQYMTASEVGVIVGVSSITASRAMNDLAQRQLLIRRKRQGTFVGPRVQVQAPSKAKCVHYLSFFDEMPTSWDLAIGDIMAGLGESLPGVAIKTHFGPIHDALSHVRAEVERAASDNAFAGFVLALGIREVQEFLAETNLPVVVHGGVYPGIQLPFLEHDQKEIGRLMAREAIALGHRRLVFINRETWRRGDSIALDGILASMREAGLGPDSLHVRNVSISLEASRRECGHLVDEFDGQTAFLCRTGFYVSALCEASRARGHESARDVCIIWDAIGGGHATLSDPLMHSFIVSRWTLTQQHQQVGRMLVQRLRGESPSRISGSIVPVTMIKRAAGDKKVGGRHGVTHETR
jgi:DNA-binding LacI/PurR family transcriptional regulator